MLQMLRIDVRNTGSVTEFVRSLILITRSREVGHRVKSLTASNFSGPEAVALQLGGNAVARSIWLGSYKGTAPEPETDNEVRWFMRQKYYESKWLNNELLKEHMEKVKSTIKELFTAVSQTSM